jgi:hypothetical protein
VPRFWGMVGVLVEIKVTKPLDGRVAAAHVGCCVLFVVSCVVSAFLQLLATILVVKQ